MKNEDFLECATVINESARNISEQIGNMLSWARIQDGSFNPAISSFDVVRSIREETELQKPILKLKEVVLTLNTTISIFIISDENLLKMAFHNLLTNAIKFTKKGGEIKVDLVENANHYQISVSDNGVGMKAEELQLLDDDKSFSKPGTVKEQGSGFGLRIAKELVGLLDGTINIESEFGVGTKVSIILPR